MNTILVISSGGREAAIIKTLNKSELSNTIYCMGTNYNPLIIDLCSFVYFSNMKFVVEFCKQKQIDLVVVGPEKYLEMGIVDVLNEHEIHCIGPSKALAQIETDKNYTRELLQNNGLEMYNPKYKVFDTLDLNDLSEYIDFCRSLDMNYVIKPINLCSGKGVLVSNEHFFSDLEGLKYAIEIISKGPLLIEEKLIGDEYTLMAYTDGNSLSFMPLVQDFKRLNLENGANTGSMGCISYSNHLLPFITPSILAESKHVIMETLSILEKDKNDSYEGIIYGSFISCKEGIKIIEYNCRFGDPECINVLELLETDLLKILLSIPKQELHKIKVKYQPNNIVSKYVVPNFYPSTNSPVSNNIYKIDKKWYNTNKSNIICSSVNLVNTELYSTKSRTLVYFNKGEQSINDLAKQINQNLSELLLKESFKFRRDIGVTIEEVSPSINYKNSGVNIDAANIVLKKIKHNIESTFNEQTLNTFGDYAGLYDVNSIRNNSDNNIINIGKYKEPVLVSSIDGVGTKISFLQNIIGDKAYKIVGEDIVNHGINDILVKGAQPLFFLDYLGSRILVPETISDIVESMATTCIKNKCVLIGGETAEMSCTYRDNEIDVVGCMIGIVEKTKIIDGPKNIVQGDIIIGLPSEGLHTNGFTLIRKLNEYDVLPQDLKDWMCQPHKSYLEEINLLLNNNIDVLGLCHVTGGGLIENPKRVVANHLKLNLKKEKLMNSHFESIQNYGQLSDFEMYRTFNCGVGMMVFIPETNLNALETLFTKNNIPYFKLGSVMNRHMDEDQIEIN